jgi:hypothetical protein
MKRSTECGPQLPMPPSVNRSADMTYARSLRVYRVPEHALQRAAEECRLTHIEPERLYAYAHRVLLLGDVYEAPEAAARARSRAA